MVSPALMSSARGDWETPPDFFQKVDAEFHFTLDAAASASNAKCPRFYTVDDDALAQVWSGVVWVNPPYGRGLKLWVSKALRSAEAGATVVMLLPARTDTQAFHMAYGKPNVEIRFLPGRLKFVGAAHGAPFPSMLLIVRPSVPVPFG